jgi:hypothetical protein
LKRSIIFFGQNSSIFSNLSHILAEIQMSSSDGETNPKEEPTSVKHSSPEPQIPSKPSPPTKPKPSAKGRKSTKKDKVDDESCEAQVC